MPKVTWKEGNLLYPAPVVLVSSGAEMAEYNLATVAWAGNISTDPPMTYISLRPSRLSHDIIQKTGDFVINLTTRRLVRATDFCGVTSGRDINKAQKLHLNLVPASRVKAPLLLESPINIECRVTEIKKLGSHDMFLAKVVCIQAEKEYIDKKGQLHLDRTEPICYSHGKYYALGKELGHFGFSIKRRSP